jgi:hypothetical protein
MKSLKLKPIVKVPPMEPLVKPTKGERYNISFVRKDGKRVKRRLEVIHTRVDGNGVDRITCKTVGTYRTSGWKSYSLSFFHEHAAKVPSAEPQRPKVRCRLLFS